MRRFVMGIAAAAALAVGASSPAASADMPMKAARPLPMVAPNWTGFYLGAHVGAGWSTIESDISVLGAVFPISSHNLNGFIGGGQLGFNYQVSSWVVVGVEGTFSGSNVKGNAPCIVIAQCSTQTDWIATAAGRIGGIVGGDTLVYVKGGGAWVEDNYNASFFGVLNATGSATRSGWLVGFGTEYRFTSNWSGVIEYNFMDFGTDVVNVTSLGVSTPVNITHKMHVAKVGLNYKFW